MCGAVEEDEWILIHVGLKSQLPQLLVHGPVHVALAAGIYRTACANACPCIRVRRLEVSNLKLRPEAEPDV